MTCEQSADDFTLTLNGFDELAIARYFEADLSDLRSSPFRFLRALVFVHQRRQGLKDKDAHLYAMELTMGGVDAYFPDAVPEVDPEDPVTDEGKEPGPAASTPSARPSSASPTTSTPAATTS